MTVETKTVSRTQPWKGAVTIGQLRKFVEVLPKTYELGITPPVERRFATIDLAWYSLNEGRAAGWYIVTFTVFSDDWGEALLHGEDMYGFQMLTRRREQKCYKTLGAIAADMLYIFGEESSVRIVVDGASIAQSRESDDGRQEVEHRR